MIILLVIKIHVKSMLFILNNSQIKQNMYMMVQNVQRLNP